MERRKQWSLALAIVAAALILVAGLFFFSESAAAQGLVPCDGPDCQACDLVTLADNVVDFFVVAVVLLATVLFVYAGFLYLTAAPNPSQIDTAHKIFWNVFIGLILVLASWLIVDIIMRTLFVGNLSNFGPWNDIPCVQQQSSSREQSQQRQTQQQEGGGIVAGDRDREEADEFRVDTRTAAQKAEDEALLRQNFSSLCADDPTCSISVNKGACGVNETYQSHVGGCTDVSRLNPETTSLVQTIASECGEQESAASGGRCALFITGGSELGHAGGTRPGTHGGGDKVDLRLTGALDRYVTQSGEFESIGSTSNGEPMYRHSERGDIWILENDHWDVKRSGV